MSVFQWIVDEDGPTTPYSDLSAVDDLLIEIDSMMEWEGEAPGQPPISPTFEQLEAGAEYALGELSKAEARYIAKMKHGDSDSPMDDEPNPVHLLIEHMDEVAEEELLRDYPEGLPENQVFVLGALALVFIDRAVGHLLNSEFPQAVNAMARASSAMHAAGFYNGEDLGVEHFRRANSSKGGEARNAKYRLLQKWSIDRYRERKWKSAHQASHELKDDVLAHAKSIGVSLSQHRAQQTIYSWFLDADKTTTEGDEKSSSARLP
ncbi:hypothetical protein [Burkholderia gladioli]|uniref:hypothetical protein n=1 Tax=Burkholderia gladioli TaxID=28095 RepID=UPI00163FCB13|nr:hypothetical protein [Burkholderia gladioli]